jgi:peroxiredoxin
MFSLSAALVGIGMLAGPALAMQPPEVGKQAPGFTLKDTEGNSHSLSDFQGKIVVLHYQQNGCPWEKAYQSYFNDVSKKYAGKDVQFLGINSNKTESMSQVKKVKQNRPIAYPVLKDPGNKVADQYAAKTTPHIYIIDKQGTLRYRGGVEKVPAAPSEVTKSETQFLEPALNALINGSEVPHKVTKSKGCGIKRE